VSRGESTIRFMREALRLAQRGYGCTSPNPMVGAVLVKGAKIVGRGWHRAAGGPHAEIEALGDAANRGTDARGASLYVTLEPCCTRGRTPPCTEAIIAAGVRNVIIAATDPNPRHAGRGYEVLRRAGINLTDGVLADESTRLNESFNHWIVRRTPLVTVKAAMSLDGKIATRTGESKWITSPVSRKRAMKLRQGADAILVGVNTVLRDDPGLTVRLPGVSKNLRRIILDSQARTPLDSRVVSDEYAQFTTVVATKAASAQRVTALERKVQVWRAPACEDRIDIGWLLDQLGDQEVTSLLVEGGGEVNASFLLGGFAQRVAFFYAPMLIGGAQAVKATAGDGILDASQGLKLTDVQWERLGRDLLLTARVEERSNDAGLCLRASSKKRRPSRPSAKAANP
jgi:diaminohydroxyphosphoribosylaminopyrimidine deaminase / 5-amino-6-(5-phosphoribosylamino)uracil reductase